MVQEEFYYCRLGSIVLSPTGKKNEKELFQRPTHLHMVQEQSYSCRLGTNEPLAQQPSLSYFGPIASSSESLLYTPGRLSSQNFQMLKLAPSPLAGRPALALLRGGLIAREACGTYGTISKQGVD